MADRSNHLHPPLYSFAFPEDLKFTASSPSLRWMRAAASSTLEPLQQPSHLSMSAWPDITVVLGKRKGHT